MEDSWTLLGVRPTRPQGCRLQRRQVRRGSKDPKWQKFFAREQSEATLFNYNCIIVKENANKYVMNIINFQISSVVVNHAPLL